MLPKAWGVTEQTLYATCQTWANTDTVPSSITISKSLGGTKVEPTRTKTRVFPDFNFFSVPPPRFFLKPETGFALCGVHVYCL